MHVLWNDLMNSLVQKADSSKQRTLNCDIPLDPVIMKVMKSSRDNLYNLRT